MSWKAEVITNAEGNWVSNRLRFETEEEAAEYVTDLAARWLMVTDTRVIESDDPISNHYINGELFVMVPLWTPDATTVLDEESA